MQPAAFEQGCDGVIVNLAEFLNVTSFLKDAFDVAKERSLSFYELEGTATPEEVTKAEEIAQQMDRQMSPKQTARHIFEVQILHVALAIEDVVIRKAAERAVQAMKNDGIGDVDALESGQAGAEIQIAVFIDTEEILVEKADMVQHGAPKDHTASGRAEDVGGLQENPVGSVAVATFEGDERAFKITTPLDFALARTLLA